MLIKDLTNGNVREYGTNQHDSLYIDGDGRTISYHNLQNGDGSRYGEYRFVMEDGEIPDRSLTPEAMNGCCYCNIGGFPDTTKVRNDLIDAIYNKLDEGMCFECEYQRENCHRDCSDNGCEKDTFMKWLLSQKVKEDN